MDPNDKDIQSILALQSIAPMDSRSWIEHGYVEITALGPAIVELLAELGVYYKEVERGGIWLIPAAEWLAACETATQILYERMRLRSLEQAATGPEPGMLPVAPRLQRWTGVPPVMWTVMG